MINQFEKYFSFQKRIYLPRTALAIFRMRFLRIDDLHCIGGKILLTMVLNIGISL